VISYQLPVSSNVTLKIFNVLGQEVITLIDNKNYEAGIHSVNFNAEGLNSGVYFYKIETSGIDGHKFTSTKKMMVVK
jgi:hypothetical protein